MQNKQHKHTENPIDFDEKIGDYNCLHCLNLGILKTAYNPETCPKERLQNGTKY
jgi:hypothetical protein